MTSESSHNEGRRSKGEPASWRPGRRHGHTEARGERPDGSGSRSLWHTGWRSFVRLTGYLALWALVLLFISVVLLRWFNPSSTAFTLMYEASQPQAGPVNLREQWVDYEQIPEHLTWAVIAAEDQRFWNHHGLDWEEIGQAWQERRRDIRRRGASTISQQVTKNLFLWPDQHFVRKAVEAGLTLVIELVWPKERILDVYLNIAQFGPGIYGIGAAALHIYGIEPEALSPGQSARLAAVLPSPSRRQAEPPSPYVAEHSRWILQNMTRLSGTDYMAGAGGPAAGDAVDDGDRWAEIEGSGADDWQREADARENTARPLPLWPERELLPGGSLIDTPAGQVLDRRPETGSTGGTAPEDTLPVRPVFEDSPPRNPAGGDTLPDSPPPADTLNAGPPHGYTVSDRPSTSARLTGIPATGDAAATPGNGLPEDTGRAGTGIALQDGKNPGSAHPLEFVFTQTCHFALLEQTENQKTRYAFAENHDTGRHAALGAHRGAGAPRQHHLFHGVAEPAKGKGSADLSSALGVVGRERGRILGNHLGIL